MISTGKYFIRIGIGHCGGAIGVDIEGEMVGISTIYEVIFFVLNYSNTSVIPNTFSKCGMLSISLTSSNGHFWVVFILYFKKNV
jgi:hypothetical protein